MSDTVQQIKDKLSIVDVVSQYVKLERAGGSMRARCPFHSEKSPSFFVSPDRGTYHCFGCGVGGDIFTFVQTIEGLDFKGVLKILAERAGVPLVEYSRAGADEKDERDRLFNLLEAATLFYTAQITPEVREYLHQRGVTDDTLIKFRLGWAGNGWSDLSTALRAKKYSEKEIIDAGLTKKNDRGTLTDKFRNRVMFPIGDSAGRIVGFSGRIFGPDASPEAPKYLNSPETPLFHKSRILYGFDKAKLEMRRLNCAILVEGQVDLVASHQAGWGNTVAVSGTAFTPEHAALVHRMTENLVIALDADEAGLKAAGRAARAAMQSGLNVKVAQLPEGLDPADLILKEGADAWKDSIKNAKDIVTFLLDVLAARMPARDTFRRAVETAVLPFVADVKSPIAREQYLHEIAGRLGVSESAVAEALARMPVTPIDRSATPMPEPVIASPAAAFSQRIQQALALLLWQKSLTKPSINVQEFEQDLEIAMGKDMYAVALASSTTNLEALRFAAERLYADRSPVSDAKHLSQAVLLDRLNGELAELTEALRRAEVMGDGVKGEALMEHSKVLTAEIARLRNMR